MASPKGFIVLGFTFSSMTHFEFSFMESMRFRSKFMFLFMDIQSFQHHLLKRPFFLPWIALGTLPKSVDHICMGVSTDQCAYPIQDGPHCLDDYSFTVNL